MQFRTLAFTAFCAAMAAAAPQQQAPGGGSSSQLAAQLPTCALPCFQEGSAKVGCTAGDFACTCTKLDAFTQVAAPCFAKACKPEELVGMFSVLFVPLILPSFPLVPYPLSLHREGEREPEQLS